MPQVDQKMQLLEDSFAIVLFTLSPLAVAIIFRFYERLYPTFKALQKQRVISGEPQQIKEFTAQIDRRCNSCLWARICLVVSLLGLGAWLLVPELMGVRGGESLIPWGKDLPLQSWGQGLPIGIKVYESLLAFMAWFALSFFLYKAVVVSRAIQELTVEGETDTAGARFSIDLYHPDRCAGLIKLSQLWLNVNYVVVIVGIGILLWVLHWQSWQDPLTWFYILGYIVLGPLLFFTPFLGLHSLMINAKEKELERCLSEWQKAKEAGKKAELDLWRKRYEEAKRLPSWPFNWEISRRFWGTYLFAPVLTIVLEGLFRIA